MAKVIAPAMKPIFAFLADSKVKKILGNQGPKAVLLEVSIKLNELAGSISSQQLLGLFDQAIAAYKNIANKVGRLAPSSVQSWLKDAYRTLQEVRASADEMIESVVGMVQDTLQKSAAEIKHQADELDTGYKALPDSKVVHLVDDSAEEINPKFIKGSKLIPPELPEFHINNFLDRNVSARLTDGDEVFYKYHGETNLMGKTHNYVTNKLYASEALLREELAILEEWGGEIIHITEFKPKKGTWIHEGKAAPQKAKYSDEKRSGLGYQGLIDVNDLTSETVVKTTRLKEGF